MRVWVFYTPQEIWWRQLLSTMHRTPESAHQKDTNMPIINVYFRNFQQLLQQLYTSSCKVNLNWTIHNYSSFVVHTLQSSLLQNSITYQWKFSHHNSTVLIPPLLKITHNTRTVCTYVMQGKLFIEWGSQFFVASFGGKQAAYTCTHTWTHTQELLTLSKRNHQCIPPHISPNPLAASQPDFCTAAIWFCVSTYIVVTYDSDPGMQVIL